MPNLILVVVIVFLSLVGCASSTNKSEGVDALSDYVRFDSFEYRGEDEIFEAPLPEGQYQNPIIAGFHPDPSIVRVDKDFYLVNSTFGFFPGLPVYHSTDLVNWQQLGNAIHRTDQMSFKGLPLSSTGLYAPAIAYKDGKFYVICTCVGCGGNFIVTATDPTGPWSDPVWLPHIYGIDPSLFFDDDGKVYVVHHREPTNKRYPAHTALWVMEVDPKTYAPRSEDVMLVDGGEPAPWHTDYIEGPHIYKINGTYYLSAPGGGTGYYHGQLAYRSDSIWGPYEPYPQNPILTQWGLADDRPNPVTATGHGDLVEDGNGDWWMVFLATRVYDLQVPPQDPGNFHTGRETFLLPVTWKDGWPVVLEKGEVLPLRADKPKLPVTKVERAMTGNFVRQETFSESELGPQWLFARTPETQWWTLSDNALYLLPRTERLGQMQQPSFVGQRIAHMKATIRTTLTQWSGNGQTESGLMALQTDDYFYAFGIAQTSAGQAVLRIRQKSGGEDPLGRVLLERPVNLAPDEKIVLQIHIDRSEIDFSYSLDGEDFKPLLEGADAKVLTTAAAGGFVGAVAGPYTEKF